MIVAITLMISVGVTVYRIARGAGVNGVRAIIGGVALQGEIVLYGHKESEFGSIKYLVMNKTVE